VLGSAGAALPGPRLTCVSIRTDETVASAARRITGDARNMQAPWFQVVNPITSQQVPKARYGLIFAGWQACIVPVPKADVTVHVVEPLGQPPSNPAEATALPRFPLAWSTATFVLWIPAVTWCGVVLLVSLTFWLVDRYSPERRRLRNEMRRCADQFVQELERAPVQRRSCRPVQSRVRFKSGRAGFEVLIATQDPLSDPSLADHERNAVKDVVRIQQALSEHAFVSGRPYARGRWVVIPFELRAGTNKVASTAAWS
jgi:hypothetical protein